MIGPHPRRLAEPHPVLNDIVDEVLARPERAITAAVLASAALTVLGRALAPTPTRAAAAGGGPAQKEIPA